MLIISLAIIWLLGIWVGSRTAVTALIWFAVGISAVITALLFHRRHRLSASSLTPRLLAHAAVFCLAAGYYAATLPQINQAHIAYYNEEQEVVVTGTVVDEPEVRDQTILLRVEAENIVLGGGQLKPVEGLVLVTAPRFPNISYGTQLQIIGNLETPGQGATFDYKGYLARQGIHSQISWPEINILAENQGSFFYTAVFSFKAKAQETIQQLLPDPQAALLTGILLGNDEGLSPQLAEQFRITGMTHIIAISGFNIAILVGTVVALGRPLFGHRRASMAALVVVFLYTLLVGADAAVVRAAVMGSLFIFSRRMMGRPTFAPASLFVAAWIMTLFNPLILWDIGFQLSFAATLGLMLYAGPFSRWTEARLTALVGQETARRLMGFLSEAVLVTIAAQILTFPLIVGYFQQLSFVSLLANLFILPAQSGVMLWGAAATLVGLIFPPLGQLLAWVAWLFLSYTIVLVRFFAAIPGAAVSVNVSPTIVIAAFALIFAITWAWRQRPNKRLQALARLQNNLPRWTAVGWTAVGIGGLAMVLILAWGLGRPDGSLHITFFDVGQGDAIFIQTPSGRQIVVDGGRFPSILFQHLGRQIPFWDREIDLVVATHPEADHINGLPGIFDRYQVGRLITNGETKNTAAMEALTTAAVNNNIPIVPVTAGEVILIDDGVRLEILNPPGLLNPQNSNQNSVALRLVYGDFSILLSGDIEMVAEQAMVQSGRPLQSVVLKAAHHGSNTSSSAEFLTAVQPQVIVISAGGDNPFGHPHPDVLARAADVGAVVLRTDELGTIEVITDGQVMLWQTTRSINVD